MYAFIKRIADNLLMLEDFSVLNTTEQVRQITGFITKTCAGFVDIDSKLVKDAVSAAVQDNEIEGMIFPELLAEEDDYEYCPEPERATEIDPYEALKF